MAEGHDIARRVYMVGRKIYSMADLLQRFSKPEYMKNGISRISDMHMKVGEPVRYRFDHELVPLPEGEPLSEEVLEALLFPLLEPDHIDQLSGTGDIDSSFELPGAELAFRINTFRDREGLACAIRVLPRKIPLLENIGFPDDRVRQELQTLQQGLVIVTGVTTSGKSTTIASLIQAINWTQRRRIITLEDPIEYVIPSDKSLISQRELRTHIRSFDEGLRSALREDPDIIFVGEMRDRETAALALTAAETGHLVLSTLHTRDARGAVSRIVDMFPSDRTKELSLQLSFALSHIIAQKLVPMAKGGGRRVAMEVLKNIPAVGHLIRSGNWHQIYASMETQAKEGLNTMEKHLADLAMRGAITREAAIRYANDPAIQARLKS